MVNTRFFERAYRSSRAVFVNGDVWATGNKRPLLGNANEIRLRVRVPLLLSMLCIRTGLATVSIGRRTRKLRRLFHFEIVESWSNTRSCITDVLTLRAFRDNFASVSSSLPTINHFVIYHSRVQSVNSIFSLLLTKTFFASFYNILQAIRLFHFHFHRIPS